MQLELPLLYFGGGGGGGGPSSDTGLKSTVLYARADEWHIHCLRPLTCWLSMPHSIASTDCHTPADIQCGGATVGS